MPIKHVSEVRLDAMLPDDVERELRAQFREFIVMLEEYIQRRDSGHSTSELTHNLEIRRDIILKLQPAREKSLGVKIEYADYSWGGTPGLAGLLRKYRSERTAIPSNLDIYPFDGPLDEERRFHETAIFRLEEELKHRGMQVESERAIDPAERVSAGWQAKKNAVLRLERERDEELKNSPESMHKTIRRVYGKAIDAIMEED